MRKDEATQHRPADTAPRDRDRIDSRRFRPTLWSALQARRIKLWLTLLGKGLFRFRIDVEGLQHIPAGEPLIVAAAPHRNWIDPLLILSVLPPLPRNYFLSAVGVRSDQRWRQALLHIAGGMVPVERTGQLNREGLALALRILAQGNRVGIFPEGWEATTDPAILPLKRGVAFLSEHSGRRVLPVSLAGTSELWRGKTLRVRIAPPLPALAAGANRVEAQVFVDRLRAVLQVVAPPPPPEPADGQKPWLWLTKVG